MAVCIDVQAFRDSVPAVVVETADRLRRDGGVGDLQHVGGGARAVVRDRDAAFWPWVGIVERVFTADCDCGAGEDLCAHAVAVALTAFEEGVAFSGAATPPGAASAEPAERAEYLQAVRCLAPAQLADLVVDYAVRDRLFATLLLGEAGMLGAADGSGLARFRAAVNDASEATSGSRWEIRDVEIAGHQLAAEVEILCVRPATVAILDLVEEAILVWDELAGYLIDAYDEHRTDPDEISTPLVEAHRDLCERLGLDQDEITGRLARLVERCHNDTVDLDVYVDLLGGDVGAIGRSDR